MQYIKLPKRVIGLTRDLRQHEFAFLYQILDSDVPIPGDILSKLMYFVIVNNHIELFNRMCHHYGVNFGNHYDHIVGAVMSKNPYIIRIVCHRYIIYAHVRIVAKYCSIVNDMNVFYVLASTMHFRHFSYAILNFTVQHGKPVLFRHACKYAEHHVTDRYLYGIMTSIFRLEKCRPYACDFLQSLLQYGGSFGDLTGHDILKLCLLMHRHGMYTEYKYMVKHCAVFTTHLNHFQFFGLIDETIIYQMTMRTGTMELLDTFMIRVKPKLYPRLSIGDLDIPENIEKFSSIYLRKIPPDVTKHIVWTY